MIDNEPAYPLGRLQSDAGGDRGQVQAGQTPQPGQNGKVERMNWTLAREWQYACVAGALQLETPTRCVRGACRRFHA